MSVARYVAPLLAIPVAVLCAISADTLIADPPEAAHASVEIQQQALSRFNSYIGGWRGVGMPKRGSRQGTWSETADWIWNFEKNDQPRIEFDVTAGKLVDVAYVSYDPAAKSFTLTLTRPNAESPIVYSGDFDEDKLVFTNEAGDNATASRITLRLLNEKRLLILHEEKPASSSRYSRVAEVGYTREGASLAKNVTTGPECVVTGGRGTIEVQYQGTTYYVCCTGCQQAFDDDPARCIAAWEQRQAEKKANAEPSKKPM